MKEYKINNFIQRGFSLQSNAKIGQLILRLLPLWNLNKKFRSIKLNFFIYKLIFLIK